MLQKGSGKFGKFGKFECFYNVGFDQNSPENCIKLDIWTLSGIDDCGYTSESALRRANSEVLSVFVPFWHHPRSEWKSHLKSNLFISYLTQSSNYPWSAIVPDCDLAFKRLLIKKINDAAGEVIVIVTDSFHCLNRPICAWFPIHSSRHQLNWTKYTIKSR